MTTRPERHFPQLDALRMFAALAVFVCHVLYVTNHFRDPANYLLRLISYMGSFGVDFFFVLSAFLITSLLMREKDRTGGVNIRAFYFRRILRIWPLYFTALAALYVTGFIDRAYLSIFAVFLGNFAICIAPDHVNFAVGPLWSICVEEQFYCLWPWAVSAFSRKGLARRAAEIWLTSILLRLYLLSIPMFALVSTRIWCFTFTRMDCLACGILVALYYDRLARFARHPVVCAPAVLLWIIAGVFAHSGFCAMLIGFPAAAVASGIFLLFALQTGRGILHNRIVVKLGAQASYAFYVVQAPVLAMCFRFLGPVWFAPAALILTTAIALACHHFIESPFLRMKSRLNVAHSMASSITNTSTYTEVGATTDNVL